MKTFNQSLLILLSPPFFSRRYFIPSSGFCLIPLPVYVGHVLLPWPRPTAWGLSAAPAKLWTSSAGLWSTTRGLSIISVGAWNSLRSWLAADFDCLGRPRGGYGGYPPQQVPSPSPGYGYGPPQPQYNGGYQQVCCFPFLGRREYCWVQIATADCRSWIWCSGTRRSSLRRTAWWLDLPHR